MSVRFRNYDFSYIGPKGKPVFVPSEKGRAIGEELTQLVQERVAFDDHYYHYGSGGHVAALHAHRRNKFLAKIDIRNFFYSIARNRVGRALYDVGVASPGNWARWSTVKSPYLTPTYVLPYGFVQSPILATLVLSQSKLGAIVSQIAKQLTTSVYLDDIAISGDDEKVVQEAFESLLASAEESSFAVSKAKSKGASAQTVLFNCEVEFDRSEVTKARKAEFYAASRPPESVAAFERYCQLVSS